MVDLACGVIRWRKWKLGAVTAVIGFLLLWLWPQRSSVSPSQSSIVTGEGSELSKPKSASTSRLRKPSEQGSVPESVDPRIKRLMLDTSDVAVPKAKLEEWLKRAGRTERNLVVCFLLSGDESYTDELALRDKSALALYATAIYSSDKEVAARSKKLLLEHKGDDPLSLRMQMSEYARKGDTEKLLQAITTLPSKEEDLMICGSGMYEAARSAMNEMAYDVSSQEMLLMCRANRSQTTESMAFGDVERSICKLLPSLPVERQLEIAGVALRLAAAKFTGVGFSSGHSTKMRILKSLPSDTLYGDTGQTVAARILELKRMIAEHSKNHAEASRLLMSAQPNQVDEYFRRVRAFGMDAANEWVISRGGGGN